LSDQQLEEMSKTAFEHQLDVLVEVHDEEEMESIRKSLRKAGRAQ
jgi:indole-3-glycerol phosphate synthase